MKALVLFWIALYLGIYYVEAQSDFKNVPVLEDDDLNDWLAKLLNSSTDKPFENNNFEEINKIPDRVDKKPATKLHTKVIAGILVVVVCVGLSVCYKRMCQKKSQTSRIDPEETVPALPPQSSPFQQGPYPPQPSIYPPQEVSYPQEPNMYLQQLNPYPPQPNPYSPESCPYPPQPTLYPLQPTPYLPQPSPYPQQPIPYPPPPTGFVYSTEQATYPPPENSGHTPLTKT